MSPSGSQLSSGVRPHPALSVFTPSDLMWPRALRWFDVLSVLGLLGITAYVQKAAYTLSQEAGPLVVGAAAALGAVVAALWSFIIFHYGHGIAVREWRRRLPIFLAVGATFYALLAL